MLSSRIGKREKPALRNIFAYILILMGVLGLARGLFVPLGHLGAFFLAGGLIAIGIGGGMRKK